MATTTVMVRPVNPNRDFPAIASVINQVDPEPVTTEQLAAAYETTDPNAITERVVIETNGEVRGFATASHGPAMREGYFRILVMVDPAYTRQGLGTALYNHILLFLKEHGATEVESNIADTCQEALLFADHRGFQITGHFFESWLDLTQFDEQAFVGIVEDVQSTGIHFRTLADLSPSVEIQKQLYELNRRMAVGVPGWNFTDYSFEQYQGMVFNTPTFDPHANFLAVDGEQWVGVTHMNMDPANNRAYTFWTGVLSAYRGRQIALALKLQTIRYAKARGTAYMWTHNNGQNLPILALNQKLGYQSQIGRYFVTKRL